jgi:protein involved in polysaccharide export with SLBB domain
MRDLNLRSLLVAVAVFGTPVLASAQRPTPEQAQMMLQNNPALVEQLRQHIMTSGMTADQIRARLKAEGYPENLLDAYLPGSTGENVHTGEDVYAAVGQLGLADSTDLELLKCGIDVDSLMAADTVMLPGELEKQSQSLPSGLREGAGRDSSTAKSHAPGVANSSRIVRRRQELRDACRQRADSLQRPEVVKQALRDSGFTIFGLDVFRRPTSQFNANVGGPVDAGYKFGPGDRIVLVLTGDVEESYTLDVTREGFVVIPQVGQVYVNNLTLAQVEELLYGRLGRVYSGVRRGSDATTHFSVSPAKLRSNLVYVVGDVMHPGAYQVSSAGTLFTALLAAGGPSDNGSLRNVQIRRAGKVVDQMDVYDYLINGDASHDVRLQNGDIVFVPVDL